MKFNNVHSRRLVLLAAICFIANHLVSLIASAQAQSTKTDNTAGADLYRSPADGGVRRWQVAPDQSLKLYKDASTASAVIMAPAPGAILSNLGCAVAADTLWCKVRSLGSRETGYVLAEFLVPSQGPDGVIPMGVDDSKHRAASRKFDAKGRISCAQEQGQTMGKCRVGIARGVGGDATAMVTFSNGFSRRLTFVHGEFTKANSTMSGSGTDTDWSLTDGLHSIRVDDQRYELPDSLVFGE